MKYLAAVVCLSLALCLDSAPAQAAPPSPSAVEQLACATPAVLPVDALVGLAASQTPAPTDWKTSALQAMVQYLLVPVLGAIALAITALLGVFTLKLKAKADAEKAEGKKLTAADVEYRLLRLAGAVVANVWATMRAPLEAASKDGVLTDDEKKALRGEALKQLLAALGEAGKAELKEFLGVSGDGLEAFLIGILELVIPSVAAQRQAGDQVIAEARAKAAEAASREATAVAKASTATDMLKAAQS